MLSIEHADPMRSKPASGMRRSGWGKTLQHSRSKFYAAWRSVARFLHGVRYYPTNGCASLARGEQGMKFKKLLATIGVTALLTGAGLMAAQSASAHDAFLAGSVSCNAVDGSATVTWTLSNDWDSIATVSNSTNSVIPNGTKIPAKTGNSNGTVTFKQTIAAPSAGKSAAASYTATWSDHTVRNINKVTVTVPSNCTVPPAKDASAAADVTGPTCDAAAVLHLTGTNVTWSGTEDGATGPKPYSSTATATHGHTFSNGDTSKKFAGELAGPLGYQHTDPSAPCYQTVDDAAASVSVSQPNCTVPAVLHLTGTNVTWSGTEDGATGPKSYSSTATATAGHTFKNGDTSEKFAGELAGPLGYQHTDPSAPCYQPVDDAAAAASVSAATCVAPATLTLTGQNVTWTGTKDGTQGPASYKSTAKATPGHTFSNGHTTKHFKGELAGPIGYQNTDPTAPCYKAHDDATASVSVTQPTCSLPGTASYLVENAELVGQLDQTAGNHTATFNAKPGHAFSDGVTTIEKPYTVAAATGNCPQPPTKPAASVTKPKLADTGSDVTVGLAAGLIALLGGATGVGIAMFRRRRGNAQA
jgi:hypothetical protein